MTAGQDKRVIDQLRRAVLVGEAAGLSDEQLLTRFIEHRDEGAFEALVRRHGPMVLGVCRRVLRVFADAEDAFQATFLILVRKAASIRSRATVAGWLHGVACHTALKARARNAKRASRERQVMAMPEPEAVGQEAEGHELRALLDQELNRLPEKYRLAIVLCDLEGSSRRDAAQQLRLPEGTLSSRLTRARAKLAHRLARRGLVVPSATVGAVLVQKAAPAGLPPVLVSSTVRSAMVYLTDAAAGQVISASVAALTEGVLKAMLMKKVKLAIVGLLAAGVVFAAAAVSIQARMPQQAPAPTQGPLSVQEDQPAPDQPVRPLRFQPATPDKKESRVRTLLKQRLDLLRARAEWFRKQHENNVVAAEFVQKADLRVYRAELDLCITDKERIAVHEKIVRVLKDMEDHFRQLQKQNVVDQGVVDDYVIRRLEAEIDLERVKEKINPATK